MALINCVECAKEISDKSEYCPNCGCPTYYSIQAIVKEDIKSIESFICLECGEEVYNLEGYCDNCGYNNPVNIQKNKIEDNYETTNSIKYELNSGMGFVYYLIAILFIVVLIIITIYSF